MKFLVIVGDKMTALILEFIVDWHTVGSNSTQDHDQDMNG